MKYSIVMPYYQRAAQFYKTLISYRHWYGDRNDYEVIIVEDIKNSKNEKDHKALLDMVNEFKDIDIKIIINQVESYNPSTHFNLGVRSSSGKYIVITNPECFHLSNIFKGFDKEYNTNKDIYIVSRCDKGTNIKEIQKFEDFKYTFDKYGHHSTKRNTCYHWCTSLTREWYDKLGGFDEAFSDGYACEDDDWAFTVRQSTIKIVGRDDLIVVHQEHSKDLKCSAELYKKNLKLLYIKWPKGRKPKQTKVERQSHREEKRKVQLQKIKERRELQKKKQKAKREAIAKKQAKN